MGDDYRLADRVRERIAYYQKLTVTLESALEEYLQTRTLPPIVLTEEQLRGAFFDIVKEIQQPVITDDERVAWIKPDLAAERISYPALLFLL